MKNLESVFAAYMVFWAVFLAYQFTIARRLSHAQNDLQQLKERLK